MNCLQNGPCVGAPREAGGCAGKAGTGGQGRKALAFKYLLILLLIGSGSLRSASGDAGQPGGFLRLGSGARALALGGAGVAIDDGGEAALWNPALLGLLKGHALASSVGQLSLGRQSADLSLALAGPGAWANWSLSWVSFSLGNDFEGRASDTGTYYTFSDQQNAYVLAHGRQIAPWLALGAAVKIYDRRLDVYSATGVGADLGLLLSPTAWLKVGLSTQELYSRNQWSTGTIERFAPVTRGGFGMNFFEQGLCLAGQVTYVEGRALRFEAGIEGGWQKLAFVRAGWRDEAPTLGAGLTIRAKGFQGKLDYAYVMDPKGLGDMQRFGVELGF